jgi:hypothetical protein
MVCGHLTGGLVAFPNLWNRRRLAEALAAAPAGRGAHGNIPL